MATRVTLRFDEGLTKQQLRVALQTAAVDISLNAIHLRDDRDIRLMDDLLQPVGWMHIRNDI
jgi:hypothetical protein